MFVKAKSTKILFVYSFKKPLHTSQAKPVVKSLIFFQKNYYHKIKSLEHFTTKYFLIGSSKIKGIMWSWFSFV